MKADFENVRTFIGDLADALDLDFPEYLVEDKSL